MNFKELTLVRQVVAKVEISKIRLDLFNLDVVSGFLQWFWSLSCHMWIAVV